MSEATLEAPVGEPLHELVDDWTRAESDRSEELKRLLEPIEEAVGQLGEWADRIAAAEQAAAEARREASTKEQTSEERRRKLEHDLKLARARVAELERSLQDRTAELLRVQAANNELAAQLQEIGDDEPLAGGSYAGESPRNEDGDLMATPNGDDHFAELAEGEPGEGVAERFARLRHN